MSFGLALEEKPAKTFIDVTGLINWTCHLCASILTLLLLPIGCSNSSGDSNPDMNALARDMSASAGDMFQSDGGAALFFCDLPGAEAMLQVPADFCIHKFAQVMTPRVMAFAPNGDLFVASPSSQTPGGAPPGIGGI